MPAVLWTPQGFRAWVAYFRSFPPGPDRARWMAEMWPRARMILGTEADQLFGSVPPAGGNVLVPSATLGISRPVPATWTLSVDSNRNARLPVGSELPLPVTMTWAGQLGGGRLWGGVTPDDDTPYGRTVMFQVDDTGAQARLRFRYGSLRGQAAGPFAGKLDFRAPLANFLPAELVPNGATPPPAIRFLGDFGP